MVDEGFRMENEKIPAEQLSTADAEDGRLLSSCLGIERVGSEVVGSSVRVWEVDSNVG